MMKLLRPLLGLSVCLGAAPAAQAQANLVHGIGAAINLGRMAARGGATRQPGDKTVTTDTYRDVEFPMKRTPANKLSGEAGDQIGLLEGQLEQCHQALANAKAVICPEARLATIRAAQALVVRQCPGWNQKYYQQELDFYLAEDARRHAADAPVPAPAPK